MENIESSNVDKIVFVDKEIIKENFVCLKPMAGRVLEIDNHLVHDDEEAQCETDADGMIIHVHWVTHSSWIRYLIKKLLRR